MTVIDSSGWLEYLMNGSMAEFYSKHLSKFKGIVTPAIVTYEVYKILKRELGRDSALEAAAQMAETHIAVLTDLLAYRAADLSLEHGLAMADSIVYATALSFQAKLITSDSDFKGLPGVLYINSEEPRE